MKLTIEIDPDRLVTFIESGAILLDATLPSLVHGAIGAAMGLTFFGAYLALEWLIDRVYAQ